MSTVTASTEVAVPIRTAYDQWTQFESFPQFMEGVERVDQLDDTHTHWKVSIGPSVREFDATITEQHPEERVAWRSEVGPKHAGVVTFHRIDDSTTRVITQMDIDPEGFVEQAADKLKILDHRVKGDLERFKEFIESRGHETGAWRGDVPRPGN
ncbi:SRPBCC family protein [Nocardia sp. CA-290969]|uniref:SRPBCC family protein n=1 Tax=Nocardia sp. CA-290969 TaxID=3239986 RepID=UPI003D94B212